METMKKLPQEGLKLIACGSMLLDHLSASGLLPWLGLRIVGRLAFPIYCFLLAEGVYHTRHPGRYVLWLAIGAALSEVPFDVAFYGKLLAPQGQNVMVTLLLACLLGLSMKRVEPLWGKLLLVAPFALAARVLRTDYGAFGVVLAAMFLLTRELPHRLAWQTAALTALCLAFFGLELQLFCVGAMVPIAFYSGRKRSNSRTAQAAFYLFYPAHLAALVLAREALWRFVGNL